MAAAANPRLAALLQKQTEGAVAAQAERAALELEAAVWSRTRFEHRPDAAYGERFRELALGLHGNAAMAVNVYRSLHEWGWVAGLTSADLASDEHKRAVEKARAEYAASVELDWKKKNRAATMKNLGYDVNEGLFACGKCKSRNTDFTERQTRSADEPTTKFAECYNCGHKCVCVAGAAWAATPATAPCPLHGRLTALPVVRRGRRRRWRCRLCRHHAAACPSSPYTLVSLQVAL